DLRQSEHQEYEDGEEARSGVLPSEVDQLEEVAAGPSADGEVDGSGSQGVSVVSQLHIIHMPTPRAGSIPCPLPSGPARSARGSPLEPVYQQRQRIDGLPAAPLAEAAHVNAEVQVGRRAGGV